MKTSGIIVFLLTVSFFSAQNIKIQIADLPKDRVEGYNQSFFDLVDALKKSDKNQASRLISDQLKADHSDLLIQNLSGGISFERKMKMHQTGTIEIDGVMYPAVQYKYEADSSVSPTDIITVVFQNDGKIKKIIPYYSK
ncbi:hypothetical protein [Chryseobacterium taihuense]|uniref:Curli production assembly/transport component CsgF n=1 Tax=Chryseobacterium taihuense TaxID=1141221 RepID=A0ABY0QUF1_9FLAO|nr:hypothetical protein [Chryseobacterium taihuense]SDL91398.1 hypothetical protein SAMN05216273_108139 [Chryseobacterium taihuense]